MKSSLLVVTVVLVIAAVPTSAREAGRIYNSYCDSAVPEANASIQDAVNYSNGLNYPTSFRLHTDS